MAINPSERPEKAPWWNPVRYFDVRRRMPIEQRSYTKMYSLLAIALFLFTLWAVMDEVMTRRPWKDIQEDFKDFKTTRLTFEIKKQLHKLNPADTMAIHKELKSVLKEQNSDGYKAKLDKIEDLDVKITKAQRDYTFTKSNADAQYYILDEARTERTDTTSKSKDLRVLESKMRQEQTVVDSLEKLRADMQATVLPVQKRLKEVLRVHDSVFADVILLQRKREAAEKAPIAVHQTMLVNYEKTNFNNLKMRVDRCVTCHLGYDDQLFKNDTLISSSPSEVTAWKKANKYGDKHYTIVKLGANKDTVVAMVTPVFRTHPDVGLLIKGHKVGEASGPGVLGCTSCHAGQGASLVSPEFAHGLEHHWAEPLLTGHYVESSCMNCHSGKMDFEGAKWISMGKKLFTDFGCYGCHNATNYDGMPKQAPSLLSISKKVTPAWMYQWIANPRGWSPETRMPNFMFSSHEVTAVVAYLNDQSKTGTYTPVAHSGGGGDATRGKQIFSEVGCFGCHAMDQFKSESRVKESNGFGPDLNKIGSKVTAEWLFDWLKNPKNYHAESRMPSLRLSDPEAADLTAYLMQHTGTNDSVHTNFDAAALTNPSMIKEGEKIVRTYGCFGCHEIKGMEDEAKVSVSLSTFGRKTVGELFYGNVPGEVLGGFRKEFKHAGLPLGELDEHAIHENQDWYTWVAGKMKNSRIYATERIPQRMPNFQMSTEEAYAISVLLKSFTGNYVAPSYIDPVDDPNQLALNRGRLFAHWNNCVGCHQIEKAGGYIGKYIDDAMFRPPLLTPEGNKVQEVWLRGFLRGPSTIRPWLKVRMPTFGFSDSSIGVATKYFLATKHRPFVLTDYHFISDPNLLAPGKALFDQLKCMSCHVVASGPGAAQQIAPNLELAKRRLRPDWVIDWLHNPEAEQAGTRMPGFWGTPKTGFNTMFPQVLAGDVEMQIRAVRDYVYSIGRTEDPVQTPYAVINGSDHYVLPNGTYDVVLTSAMPRTGPDVMTPTIGTAAPAGKDAKAEKHATLLRAKHDRTAMR
ncbi:MAG: c-type cytochrome [Candidatus Kapaibacterium sp.]